MINVRRGNYLHRLNVIRMFAGSTDGSSWSFIKNPQKGGAICRLKNRVWQSSWFFYWRSPVRNLWRESALDGRRRRFKMVLNLNLTRKIFSAASVALCGLLRAAIPVSGADSGLTEHAEALRVWRSADGLPSDSVTAILQTRDGFLWVGTSAGLVRFDGMVFTEMKLVSPTNPPVFITALCEDARGHLWIGTRRNGLFELAGGVISHFTARQGLLGDNVTSLAADRQGGVWIGTEAGLNRWEGNRFQSFTTRDGLPDEFVSNVNVARSGTVWITTRVGMCRFIGGRIRPYAFRTESQGRSPQYLGAYEDQQGNLWAFGDTYLINLAEGKRFNYFRSSESASVRIWSLCEGHDGRLWIGTSGRGLFCFENNRFEPVILGEDRWPYDVRALCEDHEGNLWLGTSGGGLMQLRPQAIHILRAGQGLPDGPVTALALDNRGKIYVGLPRGGLFVGEAGRFDRAESSEEPAMQDFITSLCTAPDGTVWVGTLGDGLVGFRKGREIHLTTADGLADDSVLAVAADQAGNLWVGTTAGLVRGTNESRAFHFTVAPGLPPLPVTALLPASGGGLWLGTQNGAVWREQGGTFLPAPAAANPEHRAVLALFEDEPGRLWIGTDGGGLRCLVGSKPLTWTITNGLPGNVVAGVVKDRAGDLWLATDAGICRIARSDVHKALAATGAPLACRLMSEVRTAPDAGVVFGGNRAACSPDGELWFATAGGVLNVDARQSEIEPRSFPIYIESAAFNGRPPISLLRGALWSPPAARNLPEPDGADANARPRVQSGSAGREGMQTEQTVFRAPDDLRSLEIHFTALDLAAPEQIQFRHKLEGFESDWVDDAGTRTARYGRLPYGRYRFRVQARLAGGKWQDGAQSFVFVVPTPVYLQTWAVATYIAAAVGLVAGLVRMVSHRRLRRAVARLEQQQSLERERMRIARDMHDEMGAKLTKISFLSERVRADAPSAGALAEKIGAIAETSRELLKTMDEIVWVVNPRNDSLENLTAYLGHYAAEYFQNTSLECTLRLPPEIPHYPLSSETRHNLFLAFEEALNNVLKHSAATRVDVEMSAGERSFELKITDNGRGFEPPAANGPPSGGRGGNGLKNMRQRLAAIGGECVISSHPGAGTAVVLRLRLSTKNSRP